MSKLIFGQQMKVYVGAFDFSGQINSVVATRMGDVVDVTALNDTFRNRLGGLYGADFQVEGFFEEGVGSVGEQFFQNVSLDDVPLTILPTGTGIVGDAALSTVVEHAKYSLGSKVGDAFRFSLEAQSSDRLVAGQVLDTRTKTTTGTANGAGSNLGAISSAQRIVMATHMLAASGQGDQSCIVRLHSDTSNAFAAPTVRLASSPFTAPGSSFLSQIGPFTDTWWRISSLVAGSLPLSFTFLVTVGIVSSV